MTIRRMAVGLLAAGALGAAGSFVQTAPAMGPGPNGPGTTPGLDAPGSAITPGPNPSTPGDSTSVPGNPAARPPISAPYSTDAMPSSDPGSGADPLNPQIGNDATSPR